MEPEAEITRLRRELEAIRLEAVRYRAVLESATDYAIFTTDLAGQITTWNAGAQNLLGWREAEALGMDSRLIFIPEDRATGEPEAEMARAVADGRAGNERWHLRKDGSRFWGSGLLVPLRDLSESGFLKIMRDRTERREADERQRVLLKELAHRVKNSLAVVLAMARQTGDRAPDVAGFLDSFEARLLALAAAHDLLSQNGWLGTPCAEVVMAALGPHDPEGASKRIRLQIREVPSINPAAAQSLAMAVHELATNAAKHGALSVLGGSVTLEARVEGGELVLVWHEEGGPPVAGPPRQHGFGTTLLERVLAHQHGARTTFDWQPEGLVCTIRLPLAGIVASMEVSSGGGN